MRITKNAEVFAELSPSPGCEKAPVLGFLAHLDTSDAASGKDVRPQVVEYKGGIIPLGTSGKTLDPARFRELEKLHGDRIVASDGTTLLGGDDKAGIAELMTALETVVREHRSHGPLRFAFTPDEEIGEGVKGFDVKEFGAEAAYTFDGGAAGEIEYQNFNAARARLSFRGFSVHPGSAKGLMVNALKLAMKFDSLLPADEVPEKTEGFQGFYHLTHLEGTPGSAKAEYILRDHDAKRFEAKKRKIRDTAARIDSEYGAGTVTVELQDQYRNMEEVIRQHFELIELAEAAVRKAGLVPLVQPVRGGTDGAMLSFMGLPCPNLGTGDFQPHGECEFVSVRQMEQCVETALNLIEAFAGRQGR